VSLGKRGWIDLGWGGGLQANGSKVKSGQDVCVDREISVSRGEILNSTNPRSSYIYLLPLFLVKYQQTKRVSAATKAAKRKISESNIASKHTPHVKSDPDDLNTSCRPERKIPF